MRALIVSQRQTTYSAIGAFFREAIEALRSAEHAAESRGGAVGSPGAASDFSEAPGRKCEVEPSQEDDVKESTEEPDEATLDLAAENEPPLREGQRHGRLSTPSGLLKLTSATDAVDGPLLLRAKAAEALAASHELTIQALQAQVAEQSARLVAAAAAADDQSAVLEKLRSTCEELQAALKRSAAVASVKDAKIRSLETSNGELTHQLLETTHRHEEEVRSLNERLAVTSDNVQPQDEMLLLALQAELEAQAGSNLQDELVRAAQELEAARCVAEDAARPSAATVDAIAQVARLKRERDEFCDALTREREEHREREKQCAAEGETLKQSAKALLLELGQSQLLLLQERAARVSDVEEMHQQLREHADASWAALLSHRTEAAVRGAAATCFEALGARLFEDLLGMRHDLVTAQHQLLVLSAGFNQQSIKMISSGATGKPQIQMSSPDASEFSSERRRRTFDTTPPYSTQRLQTLQSSVSTATPKGPSPSVGLRLQQQKFAAMTWDPELSSNITLYPRAMTAAHPGSRIAGARDSFACGSVGASDGDVSFDVRVNRPPHHRDAAPETCLYVGLASRFYAGRQGHPSTAYLLRSDGALISSSEQTVGVPYSVPLRNGSLVTVRLSFSDHRVSFYVDNVFQGVAFKLDGPDDPVLREPLFPLVVFGVDGDVATLERTPLSPAVRANSPW